jgi:hypothetical protein
LLFNIEILKSCLSYHQGYDIFTFLIQANKFIEVFINTSSLKIPEWYVLSNITFKSGCSRCYI